MSLYVSMHRPVRAISGTYVADSKPMGSVAIICDQGYRVEIYTTPEMARAIADAVNAHADAKVDA